MEKLILWLIIRFELAFLHLIISKKTCLRFETVSLKILDLLNLDALFMQINNFYLVRKYPSILK